MTATLVRFIRPTAAAVVVLLVGVVLTVSAVVPSVSAAAAPRGSQAYSWLYVYSHAVYPYDQVPGYPGDDSDRPADAGTAPGSVSVVVEISDQGDREVHDITVTTRARPDGQTSTPRCSTTPPADDPHQTVDGPHGTAPHRERQRRAPQQPSPQRRSQGGTPSSWTNPTLVLEPNQTLYCSMIVSGIDDDVVHQVDTDVSASYVDTGQPVTGSTSSVYVAAGALRPPPPGPVSLGLLVWVDVNPDNDQQLGWGEPGIGGQHVTITGPDGLPPHDYPSGDPVDRAVTTSSTGAFGFQHLRPFTTYTLTLDLRSPALTNLVKSPMASGEVSPDGSTWSMEVRTDSVDIDLGGFPMVAKNPLKVTVTAPVTAVAGTSIQIPGAAWRPGPGGGWDGHAVLEFQPGGTTEHYTWTKVADVTSYRGHLTTRVIASRSGWYRYRIPGDSSTAPAISKQDHLTVTLAPVALTATAPATVREGGPLTVTGTITRAGTPFQTGRTVLEFSPDARSWTAVTDVRSTDGTLTATAQPARTGSYRFRYLGDSKTVPGTSPARHVVVSLAANKRSTSRTSR